MKPKLRYVRVHPFRQDGYDGVLLEDPLGLSETHIYVPQPMIPLLPLMDGTRDARGLQVGVQLRHGYTLPLDVVEQLIEALDQALMLENERFDRAKAEALHAYRSAPHRPLAHAGSVYPAEPDALRRQLDAYLSQVGELPPPLPHPRAVVSPHIDYQRGGPVYARVWAYAADAVREVERVIVLGTDHNGDFGTITLTRQHYATPYGVLPTDQTVVDALVDVVGPEEAFREELHHRREHSIELALVWLHHMRAGQPVSVVPILMGSFAHFTSGMKSPEEDARLNRVVEVLKQAMEDKPTLLVAAGDLAHVGPAFGDPTPLTPADRARLKAADEELIQAMIEGDAAHFFASIAAVGDRYRICGLPPIYLLLRVLGRGQGVLTGYDQCPADAENGSTVSVCGVVLTPHSG
ncbi:MAG: AmmeMemoRadiSam system protein B [Chloroflexi bacterium]|nr:AmmeMemoRadiSam system protein B [Chloroflexota bacterium]